MKLTPAQVGMRLLLGFSLPMHPSSGWSMDRCIRHGRDWLVRITGQDFGYEPLRWHEYLWATDAGGYKLGRRSPDKWARHVRAGVARPGWKAAVRALRAAEQRLSQAAYPRLYQLFGAFFHQDWDTEGDDWPDLVRNFAGGQPQAELDATAAELERLVCDFPADAALDYELFRVLGCGYTPRPDLGGPTVKAWLGEIAAFLQAGAKPGRTRR